MAEPTRIALIGCGVHARSVLLPALTLAGARVVACYDSDPGRAATLAAIVGATVLPDLDALLREGVDAAVVASPPQTHAAIVTQLAEAGTPTFVEKPGGVDTTEIGRLIDDLGPAGRRVQVGYMRRFSPALRQLRQLTRTWRGALSAQVTIAAGPIVELHDFLYDVAVHHLDLCRWLLGEPESVVGSVLTTTTGPTVQAVLTANRGTAGLYLSAAGTWGHPTESILVQGGGELARVDNAITLTQQGAGRMDLADDVVTRLPEVGATRWAPNFANPRLLNNSLYLQGYVGELTAFVRGVRMGSPLSPGLGDARAALRLAETLAALSDRTAGASASP